jgi:NADH/NAD ratio-sensing transcriptional regulator Rex
MAFKRYIPVESISELTINRLSVYLRCLQQLEYEGGTTISSQELADRFHLNSAQIRKDLAYFGEFGVRGIGYYVSGLKAELQRILGLDREWQVALVGFGKPAQRVRAVDGGIRIATTVQATLAADHRASDGHRGALFLAAIKDLLQQPDLLER